MVQAKNKAIGVSVVYGLAGSRVETRFCHG